MNNRIKICIALVLVVIGIALVALVIRMWASEEKPSLSFPVEQSQSSLVERESVEVSTDNYISDNNIDSEEATLPEIAITSSSTAMKPMPPIESSSIQQTHSTSIATTPNTVLSEELPIIGYDLTDYLNQLDDSNMQQGVDPNTVTPLNPEQWVD
ncbi:MAG TPA: hypothetical protein DER68_05390 [Ruminococcaceae bacterium]|nr:hypothetical protein [Oscillospiraceae bacterium]